MITKETTDFVTSQYKI